MTKQCFLCFLMLNQLQFLVPTPNLIPLAIRPENTWMKSLSLSVCVLVTACGTSFQATELLWTLMERWSWMPLSWMDGRWLVAPCPQWRTSPTPCHWPGQWWKRWLLMLKDAAAINGLLVCKQLIQRLLFRASATENCRRPTWCWRAEVQTCSRRASAWPRSPQTHWWRSTRGRNGRSTRAMWGEWGKTSTLSGEQLRYLTVCWPCLLLVLKFPPRYIILTWMSRNDNMLV